MALTYDIFSKLYPAGIRIASLFNTKARQWIEGRKNIFQKLENTVGQNQQPLLWMHCASLGEFEMGRTILENFKNTFPNYKILLTFFSPSGYEIRKDYKGADYIFYLPSDSKENAEKFVEICKPTIVIFVKYEFWHYYLQTLKFNEIPLLLISAVFRPDQLFFKKHGEFFKKDLSCFQYFFVQNNSSLELLKSIDIHNATISGDTRFDRVVEIAKNWKPIEMIENFCSDQQVLVAGSTWEEDENSIAPFILENPQYKYIIAPHEISKNRIEAIQKRFPHSILFSQLEKSTTRSTAKILIIDNIGMLNRLYNYATVTYVGGAWGTKGIHNILEAAAYAKPVLYGPNFAKNYEAQELINCGGGFAYIESRDLCNQLNALFTDRILLKKSSLAADKFVKENIGATQIIMNYIQQNLL